MRFVKYVLILILLGFTAFIALLYWDYRGMTITESNNLFEQVSASDCRNVKAQDVHIAYITDENYLHPTQVSAFSAIQNKCPQTIYYFHIIAVNMDAKQAEPFFQPLAQADVHFEIIPQTELIGKKFPVHHITSAALLKLVLPEILPNLDRIIFLDSDTLVMKDLQELFTTDLQDFVMGAVSDIGIIAQGDYLQNLNFRQPIYYNAGMLLMNLKKMRQEKISDQLKNYLYRANGLVFLEQDTFNIVLQQRIKTLPYKYNCAAILEIEKGYPRTVRKAPLTFWQYLRDRIFSTEFKYASNFFILHKNELPFLWHNVFKETAIFHYFGAWKPWNGPHPKNIFVASYFNLWHKYADQLEQLKEEH